MEVKLTTEVRDKEVWLSVSNPIKLKQGTERIYLLPLRKSFQSYKTQTRGCLIGKRAYESLPTL